MQSSSDTSSSFEWDEYLAKTHGRPADPKCFKQSNVPPLNMFEINCLLEAEDQRSAAQDYQASPLSTVDNARSRSAALGGTGTTPSRQSSLLTTAVSSNVRRFRAAAFTLAQVIEVCGSRIRIRLIGTDDRNDCWFLTDSDQIRAYPSGEPLQPPFGYMHNHLHWSRTLKNATEGAKYADPSWFITPPIGPADNFFQIGDKLEAVDRRNTQLICPATVSAINGHHILISFDGWSDFDYWTRFDSRELFPVGWCKLSGYPLQPPGPHALRSPPIHSTPATITEPRSYASSRPSSTPSVGLSKSTSLKTPLRRSRGGLTSGRYKRGRTKLRVTTSQRGRSKKSFVSTKFSGENVWERLGKPLSVIAPDASSEPTQSADSSMRSLSSPPIIHPINDESSLNLSVSSSEHPPTIEAALPLPAETTRARRTSSSSDCVVRLQLKPSPSSANATDRSKAARKSWEVVRTNLPRDKARKTKTLKRHRHSLKTAAKRQKISVNEAPDSRSETKAESTAQPRATPAAVCPVSSAPSKSFATKAYKDSTCPTSAPPKPPALPYRFEPPCQTSAQFPLHLYCDEFHGPASSCGMPFVCPKSTMLYPPIRPDSLSSMEDELLAGTHRTFPNSTGRSWYPSIKSDVPGVKVMDNVSTSHSTEDYIDGQSTAPQISSSTVSPSSLDLGPGPLPNPAYWTIDEVCHYITTRDSSLSEVAEKFKHHEIDGQALLLLNMESLRNYLKIKLGPALKVDHLISRLKRGIL